ncbi:hypothetical protein C8F01DRAFT_1105628 [Mycena amicta]|nr:hypothetical protein C8F01DRAFT_1105628 [Mycena amicta]
MPKDVKYKRATEWALCTLLLRTLMASSPPAGVPVPDPQVIAAAIKEVKEVFATSFIGFAVSTAAYGIGVLQCYLYYRNYPKDRMGLKITVGALWLFDTLSSIMVAHSLYTYFIFNFGNLAADALVPWSFALENGILTGVTLTAQCFYSWQLWTLGANILATGIILALAFSSFGLGLYITVHLFRDPTVASIGAPSFEAVSGPVQGTASACDILITIALIYYLRSRREASVRGTRDMIDTLILYTMCRGIVTSIAQIMFLALNVGLPDHTYWQPFHQLMSKLYLNSILVTLNSRKSVLGKGIMEHVQRSDSSDPTKPKPTASGTDSTMSMPLAFVKPKINTGTTVTFDQGDPYSGGKSQEALKMDKSALAFQAQTV